MSHLERRVTVFGVEKVDGESVGLCNLPFLKLINFRFTKYAFFQQTNLLPLIYFDQIRLQMFP